MDEAESNTITLVDVMKVNETVNEMRKKNTKKEIKSNLSEQTCRSKQMYALQTKWILGGLV